MIKKFHDIVLNDPKVKVREIPEIVSISTQRVVNILHTHLCMRKICADGCHDCSSSSKTPFVWPPLSKIWPILTAVQKSFCVDLWRIMKHEFTIILRNHVMGQNSGWNLVKMRQSVRKRNNRLQVLWLVFSGMHIHLEKESTISHIENFTRKKAWIGFQIASVSTVSCRDGPQRLLSAFKPREMSVWYAFWVERRSWMGNRWVFWRVWQIVLFGRQKSWKIIGLIVSSSKESTLKNKTDFCQKNNFFSFYYINIKHLIVMLSKLWGRCWECRYMCVGTLKFSFVLTTKQIRNFMKKLYPNFYKIKITIYENLNLNSFCFSYELINETHYETCMQKRKKFINLYKQFHVISFLHFVWIKFTDVTQKEKVRTIKEKLWEY